MSDKVIWDNPYPADLDTGNSQDTSQQIQNNGGFWGSIVGTVGDLANGFNYKKQENDIELAKIRAQQAAANSRNKKGGIAGIDSKYFYIAGAVILIIIGFVVFNKQKEE